MLNRIVLNTEWSNTGNYQELIPITVLVLVWSILENSQWIQWDSVQILNYGQALQHTIRMQKYFDTKIWAMKCCLNPASLFAYYPTHNPSEGSLGFLGRAALANWWNMNLGPVARNREVVSQKKCSQLYSSHRTLHFSQLLDDWSNPCDVFVWKVFIFSLDKSVHTIQSIVSWRIKLLVRGCGLWPWTW